MVVMIICLLGVYKVLTSIYIAIMLAYHLHILVHVEKLMAIVLLCEGAQQFMALMMILQCHKTLNMISMASNALLQCFVFLRHLRSCLLCFFDNSYPHSFIA